MVEFQHTMVTNPTMVRPLVKGENQRLVCSCTLGTDLRPYLPTLSALRSRGEGYVQLLGPPDSRTSQSSALLLLHGPEKPGSGLSRRIIDETGRNCAGEIVVCI